MSHIHGPIISSSDINFHTGMFEQVFDMSIHSNTVLSRELVNDLFSLPGHSASYTVLQTPGSEFGVRIFEFSPLPRDTIRDRNHGMIPGAAKVIDFFVDDLELAFKKATDFGLVIVDDIAEYMSPQGLVKEAHAWVLDEIVCAIIEAPAEMLDKFTAGLGRRVSEPQSISGPTQRIPESAKFFKQVLGFDIIYEYDINNSNFGDMIGSESPINIDAKNIGSCLRKPYIGHIDYGRKDDVVIDAVNLPTRGLLGVTIVTDEIDEIAKRARRISEDDFSIVRGIEMAPWGGCSGLLLMAPNGMLLQVIQPE